MIVDYARPVESGICRSDPAATTGDPKVDCTTPNGVGLDIRSTHEAVIIMGPWTSEVFEDPGSTTVDQSLFRPIDNDIAVDQLMRAVEGVRHYVKVHLARYGNFQDVDDIMQDIRVAAWEGAANGNYQTFPGVTFDAWVQGIACNLCAHHIRRTIARPVLPLDEQFVPGINSLTDMHMMRVEDQATNCVWATEILQFVKAHVPERTWDLAMTRLSDWKPDLPTPLTVDASARTCWNAVNEVRQMALTVSHALDVEPQQVVDVSALRSFTVCSMPNSLLQLIASDVVLPATLGKARAAAISGVAEKSGVSVRYVQVQIGLVRRLVLAAEEILRASTGIEDSVIKTPVTAAIRHVSEA